MRTLLLLTSMMTACAPALRVAPDSDPIRYEGRVAFDVPEGWEATRHRRFGGNQTLTLRTPDPASAVTVRLMRERPAARELALPMAAEALSVNAGRSQGVESELVGMHRLELADREAWVATVRRRHGPVERLESSAYLRGERHLIVLSLHTVPDAPQEVLVGWDGLLGSLSLPLDAPSDTPPFLMESQMESELDALGRGEAP